MRRLLVIASIFAIGGAALRWAVTLLPSENTIASPSAHSVIISSHNTGSDSRHRSWPMRRLLVIASIFAIGGAALGWAVTLFPSESTIASPPSYVLFVGQPPGWIITTVSLVVEPQVNGTIEIQSQVSATRDRSKADPRQKDLFFDQLSLTGTGITIMHCPARGQCGRFSSPDIGTFINFSDAAFNSTATAVIRDPSFGFTENNVMAVAQIPYISVANYGSNNDPIIFYIEYWIPHANTYDWSEPPANLYSNEATWLRTVTPATYALLPTQAVELTGTNHAAQVNNERDTFISGALFGLVGAAALAAAQETLHLVFDKRRRDEAAAEAA